MGLIPVFHGAVTDDGRLVLEEAEQPHRRRYLQSLAGRQVDVVVKPHKDTRSLRANNYYWGLVLTPMSKDGSDGDQSPEDIHDAMCAMFLPDEQKRVEFFNRMTGECLSVPTDPRHSSKLKGDEFYDFVEKVRKFALEFMGVITEDPDPEYWRRRKDRAA
jgi:hypothetical protein